MGHIDRRVTHARVARYAPAHMEVRSNALRCENPLAPIAPGHAACTRAPPGNRTSSTAAGRLLLARSSSFASRGRMRLPSMQSLAPPLPRSLRRGRRAQTLIATRSSGKAAT